MHFNEPQKDENPYLTPGDRLNSHNSDYDDVYDPFLDETAPPIPPSIPRIATRYIPGTKTIVPINLATTITIITLITSLLINTTHTCAESITLNADRTSCTMDNNQNLEYFITQVTRIDIAPKVNNIFLVIRYQ